MAKASATIDVSALRVAGEGASKYITTIGTGGISVHDANDESNYVHITANGMEVFQDAASVAKFGPETRVGNEAQSALFMTDDSIEGKGENGKEFFSIAGTGSNIDIISSQTHRITVAGIYTDPFPAFKSTTTSAKVEFIVSPKNSSGGAPHYLTFTGLQYASAYNQTQTYLDCSFIVTHTANENKISFGIDGTHASSVVMAYDIIVKASFTNNQTAPVYSFGSDINATGAYAFAVGNNLNATSNYQTVFGKYNNNKDTNIFEIGSGTSSYRYNIFEIDTSGNITVCNHSSPIGTIVEDSQDTTTGQAITTTGMSNQTVGSTIPLRTGIWVVSAQWQFQARSSGTSTNLEVGILNDSTIAGRQRINVYGSSNVAIIQAQAILNITGNTYVKVYGASGATISSKCPNEIHAVRIA